MKSIVALFLLAAVAVNCQKHQLTNPELTNWGDWFGWERCEEDSYAAFFELKTDPHGGSQYDDVSNTGIRFTCKNYVRPEIPEKEIDSISDSPGLWGEKFRCPDEGYITGFQMRSEASQGALIDDTAANNLRIFCNQEKTAFTLGDGGTFGTWTVARHCNAKHAFCGIRTQVEIKAQRIDETSLNNFMVECCEIIHPAKQCVPVATWERILSCNNLKGDSSKECVHETRAGLSYGSHNKYPSAAHVYESNGFKLEESVSVLKQNVAENLGKHFVSGVSGLEKSGESSIGLAPGHFSHVEQLVVSCGIYTMRTNQLKRIDSNTLKQTKETYFSF